MELSFPNNPKNYFRNIKSNYRLKEIFKNIKENKLLDIIKYNKNIQKRLNIGINDYIEYYNKIIIDIFPVLQVNNCYNNKFINIPVGEESYYHIYFNNDKNETKLNYFSKDLSNLFVYHHYNLNDFFDDDKNEEKLNDSYYFPKDITKIKVIIDSKIKSLNKLFYKCEGIEKINFIKFNRKDINNMSYMFYQCYSLKELNFNNIYTNNVTNMSYMFYHCYSLK